MKEALENVATHLGNTASVCKKYYVHPLVINLYENKSIKKYLDGLDGLDGIDDWENRSHQRRTCRIRDAGERKTNLTITVPKFLELFTVHHGRYIFNFVLKIVNL